MRVSFGDKKSSAECNGQIASGFILQSCGSTITLNCGLRPCHLCQAIIRVVMVYGCRGDEFMLHENGGRIRALVQNIEADPYYVLPIAVRKIGKGYHKTRLPVAQLSSALW